MQKKLRYVTFRSRKDKIAKLSCLFSNYLNQDVLDVGCGEKHLAMYVHGRYVGVDIAGTPDVLVNVENGLPFHDMSFDTVVALDVLEHLDHFHFVFDELCRVCRYYLIIRLPNMYEWHFRLMFLLGKNLGGKYGLPCELPADRHRYLFSLNEARNFVKERGARNGFTIVEEVFSYSRRFLEIALFDQSLSSSKP